MLKNQKRLLLFCFSIFLCSSFAWSKSNRIKPYQRYALVWNGIEIDAYPVSSAMDSFKLNQTYLSGLSCFIQREYRNYTLYGKDSAGTTILSYHYYDRYTEWGNQSRPERDAINVANTVLKRYIAAGICSGKTSKYYRVRECSEETAPERCPPVRRQKESEYW